MATLDNLPEMISEKPELREDLISTLVSFCQRHGIDAAPEDFVGLGPGLGADTAGHAAFVEPVGSLLPRKAGEGQQELQVLIYRDGPRTTRWIWSG